MTSNAQNLIRGSGVAEKLNEFIYKQKTPVCLLVTGRHSFAMSGAEVFLDDILVGCRNRKWVVTSTNPSIVEIERAVSEWKHEKPDIIIAVGGGSVLDTAKMIKAFIGYPGNIQEATRKNLKVDDNGIPYIAIPTTSGSGSEATHFAVVYIDGEKFSYAQSCLMPEVVVLRPEFTYSMSPENTAASGMDAMCQAIESLWSVNADEESMELACKSLTLADLYLVASVTDATPDSREHMQMAANLAGQAINRTKTTGAHAFSYHLTSKYGLKHGHAVSLFISDFLEFNYRVSDTDCHDPRGADAVHQRIDLIVHTMGCRNVIDTVSRLNFIRTEIGLANPFNDELMWSGIRKEVYEHVNLERLGNNPRRIPGAGDELPF